MDMRTDRLNREEWAMVDQFHNLVHNRTPNPQWRGVPIIKWPCDLITYQEVLCAIQPDTLIECGTAWGGSTLFFASVMDMLGKGRVISIDVMNDQAQLTHWMFRRNPLQDLVRTLPEHPRITYLTGDTTAASTLRHVKQLTSGTTMVVLDSSHDMKHVLKECRLYAPLVTVGSYLVVEDININGHPVYPDVDIPGPYEATFAFLHHNEQFKWHVELTERYFMSGLAWLIRIAAGD